MIQKKGLTTQSDKVISPFSIFNRPGLLSVLVFFMLSILFSLLIFQRYQLAKKSKEKEAFEIVHHAKDRLQEALTHSLAATKILDFLIDKNGQIDKFDSVAEQVLESGKDIDAIELVPGGIIKYVYPLQGNENVIGYNILQDTTRNKEAYKAIEKKKLFFAGPIALKQGGMGVVGRLPVFRQNKFWGFSAVVIKMETLYKSAGIDTKETKGYYFQLSKINLDTKKEEFFLPEHKELANMQSVSVEVPDGEWQLSVNSVLPNRIFGDMGLMALLGLLLSVLAAVFAYHFAIRPKKLNELVLNRTSELKVSENNYRSLIERVSDAFVALDKNWQYTYVNEKAGEILGRESGELLGKNIWQEFPKIADQAFKQACYRAMEIQEYQYVEEYFPQSDKWLENNIYPSKNGLTVFFKDVTEIKEITQALKNNEEKYRSLIEQASDGIVITDMEGNVLEINKSIQQMLGYEDDEIIGHHIINFLNEEDINEMPLQINELLQGKSLLYQRKLIKKDGTFLDVEVNSKMATSHTLIGFIRDITERKEAERALKKSNERFELIANATNDAIWDHDYEKNETWGNNKLYELYGLEPGKDKINFEMFLQHIQPEQKAGIEERMNTAIKNKIIFISEIFGFKNKKEDCRTFYDRAYIKYDENGKPLRILGAMQDITENETTQQQIIKEKELSDSIINSLPGIFYLYNKEGKFLRWNKNFERVTGYTSEEMKKLHPLDLFDKNDQALLTDKIANVFVTGRDDVEADFLLKNGGKTPYYFTGESIEYEGEICLMGMGLDFSERKKAAEIVLQSEKKYKLLFNDNPMPMWMSSASDLNIIDVNEAAIKQYGYTRDEFLKLNLKDMRPVEDVAYFLSEIKNIDLSVKNNRQWHQKKDGTIIQVEVISNEIIYNGKRVWLSLPHDITEEYLAKELLEKSYTDIRQLASNLQSIREDERTNMAREIHDELGQQLTGLKMDIYWLSRKIKSPDVEITNKLNESIELINATVASVRKIATDLRPSILDDLGLTAALEWHGEEFEKRSGIKVEFNNKSGDISLKPELVTTVFRIYQELLTNVARHANASLVKVLLQKKDGKLFFSVTDNGVGFDPETIGKKKTLGLLGIKERSLLLDGTYEFKSKPGDGSETIISIPIME